MMLTFKSFNESINFEESELFKNVKQNNRIKDSDIKDYFTELIDDDFQIVINTAMSRIEGGFKIRYAINFLKKYDDYKSISEYSNVLKDQVRHIELIESNIQLLKKMEEDIEITNSAFKTSPSIEPLDLVYTFSQNIHSDELEIAQEEFFKSDNKERDAYEKILKYLKKRGINNPEKNLSYQMDYDTTVFGFLTDYEIIIVAEYHPIKGLMLFTGAIKGLIDDLYNDEELPN